MQATLQRLLARAPLLCCALSAVAWSGEVSRQEAIGWRLFFDPILSRPRNTSCGTCHKPEHGFEQTLMAMETQLGSDGVSWRMPAGTDDEIANLRASYEHLKKLRDEVIEMGVLPPLSEWSTVNPNL